MSNKALRCARCEKQLDNALGNVTNQPYQGLAFTSSGHYGSTIFDPMVDGTYLELNICDKCLSQLAGKQLILHGVKKPVESHYQTWKPDE